MYYNKIISKVIVGKICAGKKRLTGDGTKEGWCGVIKKRWDTD